ncbi:MAG: acyltransferase domain-containing protein [Oligoflexia bacterium]|nr:acyltransferase domain-containing protein [Oligoflexia bacterium]
MRRLEKIKEISHQIKKTPIAIIGMAGIFPESKNLLEFWHNILQGKNCITDIPKSRWNIDDYYDPDPTKADKTYGRKGGFIPDIDFDPVEFGLPPNILEVIDGSQLLSLYVARHALIDAGLDKSRFSDHIRERTGVILGVSGATKTLVNLSNRLQSPVLEKILKSCGLKENDIQNAVNKFKNQYINWNEDAFPGLLGNVIAGRITNRFDLGGVSSTVDAACASALSALKIGVSELTEGRCDIIICGGVDLDNSPFSYMCFTKTPAFSRSGHSKPFDEKADGMICSEGIGMMILKRLEDAEADNDRIYAVIKGIGTSSDGKAKSIYAPSSEGQIMAMKRAYGEAGYESQTIELIEAHGTGTPSGDAVEIQSIKTMFSENNSTDKKIAIGSVKSQIGHTKAAAGAAGLMKTILALHHKVLPQTINIEVPNTKVKIDDTNLYFNACNRPWIKNCKSIPRRAGVSAFGFGGVNVHIALEEYQSEHKKNYRLNNINHMIIIHSRTTESLLDHCHEIIVRLKSEHRERYYLELLKDSQVINDFHESARIGFVSSSIEECIEKINFTCSYLKENPNSNNYENDLKGVYYKKHAENCKGKIAAIFVGQGSQYLNMGKDLAQNYPQFRNILHYLDNLFYKENKTILSQILYPVASFDEITSQKQKTKLDQSNYAQPAIAAISMGMYKLLSEAGLHVDFLAGHSFGEITALWAAGILNEEDYLKLSYWRGQAMYPQIENTTYNNNGSMLAIKGNLSTIKSKITKYQSVYICNINSPEQIVIGGAADVIKNLQMDLQKDGLVTVLLPVSAAFHTPLIEYAKKPFSTALNKVRFNIPKNENIYSNTHANIYPKNIEEIKNILTDHIFKTVNFKEEIESMYNNGARVFIEFGPKNILSKLISEILKEKEYTTIALNESSSKDSDYQFALSFTKLKVLGVELTTFDNYVDNNLDRFIASEKSSTNITLNGGCYVSDKRKNNSIHALNDNHNIDYEINYANNNHIEQYDRKLLLQKLERIVSEVNSLKNALLEGETSLHALPTSINTATITQPEQSNSKTKTNDNLQNLFLSIVSEKTGYPIEMIKSNLDMESDLGIDSIKRVEIFGVLQEKDSSLTHIDAQKISELKTINDVFLLLCNKNPPSISYSTPIIEEHTTNVVQFSEVKTKHNEIKEVKSTDNKAQNLFLSIVSEKTGYPIDMIKTNLEMESDLGIDSIKRVEIFGVLQERDSSLPTITAEQIANLKTIADVLSILSASTEKKTAKM